ncbi:amidohydrolase family protein [Cyclobacterium marinum]|uniref:Amidohydrolase n=1 Tax=Cyclobacterium marinum (strain ATCC 25205 / DSM 745 / LMG 13164 / NCIMB 1802) TaxID=880070 RepID=G0J5M4_CYCMS|nr:amidohydrolase family protein [Cyclobacterium marinum]AEL28473.1 amidohydrolase [Cyclobacterium marinum DSM 745]MBI0398321.1 amidohydrolase family protein [Cyclobacterium marinum]
MNKKILLLAGLLIWLGSQGFAQENPVADVLIKNAKVLTITNGTLENTDVLIQKGIITEIGADLKAKKSIPIIDAEGQYLMPGIIDAHSHLALEIINEASSPITSEVQMRDVIDPFDISIYRALAGGTTISHAMHGSANVIGGQNVTLKHRYGTADPGKLIMDEAPRTIKFALGENPTRVHGIGKNLQPRSRMGVEAVIRNGFEEALQYKRAWEKWERDKKDEKIASAPPKYNSRLQTLVDILEGEIIIHCHSYRADEIYMLIQVCQEYGIENIVFSHVNEGFKVAPELAKYTMGASVFSDWWAYKFEVYYSTAYNAAILTKNGVVTSINSDSDELIRHLYHEAAKTQRYGGLSDEEALALITINPAKQLGIDQFVGSIEVGKQADLVLFDKHPLSIYAIPQMTWVDGVKYFDRASDDADQRLKINVNRSLDPFRLSTGTHNCMQDVDMLFTENQHY